MSNFAFLTRTIDEHISSEMTASSEQNLSAMSERIETNLRKISQINSGYLNTQLEPDDNLSTEAKNDPEVLAVG